MKKEFLTITLGGLLAVAGLSVGCGDEAGDVSGSESELRKGQLADGGSCHCPADNSAKDGTDDTTHGNESSMGHQPSSSDGDGGVTHGQGRGKGHSQEASADCTCESSAATEPAHGKSGDHAHQSGDGGTHGKSGDHAQVGADTQGLRADHAHQQGDAGTHGKSGEHTTK